MAYSGTREDGENEAVNDATEAERLMMTGGQRSREVVFGYACCPIGWVAQVFFLRCQRVAVPVLVDAVS